MDADDDDEALERLYSRVPGLARQQPMSPRDRKIRTNPSREDLSRRRRNRRTAVGGEMTSRADLMRAVAQAKTLSEQQRLLDQVRAMDEASRRTAALDRELDFAADVVAHTFAPVRTHVMHTAATDWLAGEVEVPRDFQHRAAAEAAAWFGRTSAAVRADREEFQIQAEGKARQISGQFGLQAQAAAKVFLDYATFLRTQAASGLDQIQQTTAPDGVTERPTPLPEDVFDNFAPPVHPINEGVSGTESSDRAPLIQEIMGGGSGMDGGAPEKPIEHDTGDNLSWAPPSGMQADTAPGWGDGDPGTPEKGGDRPEFPGVTASRYGQPSVAIGGYGYTLDDFRRQAAAQAGQGNDRGGVTAANPFKRKPQPEPEAPTTLHPRALEPTNTNERMRQIFDDSDREDAEDARLEQELYGRHEAANPFKRKPKQQAPAKQPLMDEELGLPYGEPNSNERFQWAMADSDREDARDRALEHDLYGDHHTAASGLDQIDQTVAPDGVTVRPTAYPGEVAFPLNEEFQGEPTTGGTGQVQGRRRTASHKCSQCGGTVSKGKCSKCGTRCNCAECKAEKSKAARRVQADMYGNSDAPHAVKGGPVANSPATTPAAPYGSQSAGQAAGRADANAGNAPTFSDASSGVPGFAQGVGEGYAQQMELNSQNQPTDMPGSMVGAPNATTHAGSRVSSLIVTATEMQDPDFRKGYGYGSRWQPGMPLVSLGSASFEAGVYAGISDNPAHQKAFVRAHRDSSYNDLAVRAKKHSTLTHRIASKNDQPTNGLYLTAATSIELNTTAPNTTPAADGSTPINGRGNPGPLDGLQDAAAPGGPSPYNGAQPFGSPVVPGGNQAEPNPADALTGGGGMSTPAQVSAFRKRVQANLLAMRQGK